MTFLDKGRSSSHNERKANRADLRALRVLGGGKSATLFLLASTLACATPGLSPAAAPTAGGVDMQATLERLGGYTHPDS